MVIFAIYAIIKIIKNSFKLCHAELVSASKKLQLEILK